MEIRSINVNGYAHKKTKRKASERLQLMFGLLEETGHRHPDIIALQEVIPAMLNFLFKWAECRNYEVIVPKNWDVNLYPRSVMCVVLIKKDAGIEEIEILPLDELKLKNRITFVKLLYDRQGSQKELNLINWHLPPTIFPNHRPEGDAYTRARKAMIEQMYSTVRQKVSELLEEKRTVILCGDFNRLPDSEEIKAFVQRGMRAVVNRNEKGPTFFLEENEGTEIDHMLTSADIVNTAVTVNRDIVKKYELTDHAELYYIVEL